MTTLVQVSDPHFGTEQEAVVNALVRMINAVAPDVVVLSGDITQRARRSQFAAARRFVDQLQGAELVAIPGNHDIPLFNPFARLFRPYANYLRAFGALESHCMNGHVLVVSVNTTRPMRHKDGEVSQAQIAAVAAHLRNAEHTQLRIVVTHQPVHVIRKQDLRNLLHGHEAAIHAWTHAGADIIMGGHIHLPHVRSLRDRFPDLPRNVWSVQAGTAVSTRVRDNVPNSVNVLRFTPEPPLTCRVERWDYSSATERFAAVVTDTLTLDRLAMP